MRRGLNENQLPMGAEQGATPSARFTQLFASFMANCSLRLLLLKRFDAVLALTSPPLISFLGSTFTRLKGGKFYFWVMDLNPDEAVAAAKVGGGLE